MEIRTNRFVKLFVTLLFLLEFFSPAFSLEADALVDNYDETCQIKTCTHPGILLALFNEQLNENEGGRSNDKSVANSMEPLVLLPSGDHAYFQKIGLAQVNKTSLLFNLHPSLFRLHHSYLI